MSDQSTEDLEREAENIRSQVVDRAEGLREKMTGGQLVDDLMSNETLSAATGALSSLGRQIQSNPVPFALIGVGLAWAMFGPAPRWSSLGSSGSRYVEYRGRRTPGNDQSSGGLKETADGPLEWGKQLLPRRIVLARRSRIFPEPGRRSDQCERLPTQSQTRIRCCSPPSDSPSEPR